MLSPTAAPSSTVVAATSSVALARADVQTAQRADLLDDAREHRPQRSEPCVSAAAEQEVVADRAPLDVVQPRSASATASTAGVANRSGAPRPTMSGATNSVSRSTSPCEQQTAGEAGAALAEQVQQAALGERREAGAQAALAHLDDLGAARLEQAPRRVVRGLGDDDGRHRGAVASSLAVGRQLAAARDHDPHRVAAPASRTVSSGSSRRTVPAPTITASAAARIAVHGAAGSPGS